MANPLSCKQIEDIRKAFLCVDSDKDDVIQTEDIATVMRLLGQNPTAEEDEEIKAKFARDCDSLNVDQVIEIIQSIGLKSQDEVYEELMIAFKAMDADGNGSISKEELKRYMQTVGEPLTDDEVDEMMNLADADKNGTIDWNEFITILCQYVM